VKLRRTLLTAGVFALAALTYVPRQRYGYSFIYSPGNISTAFFQLLVNVVFAALLGAILATVIPKIVTGVRRLPKWVWRGIGGIALIALFSVGAVAWWNFTEAAQRDERYANKLFRERHDVFDQAVAEFYFRNAARNWRLALRFDEATRVENRIKELQQQAEFGFVPDRPGQRAPTPLPSPDIFDQISPLPSPKKYISTDPNFGLTPKPEQFQTSAYASGSDFAKHGAKLREQALLDLEPQVLAPRGSRPATEQFPWKTNVVTTVFWIGEPRSSENPKAHVQSAWDANWTANYGGVDRAELATERPKPEELSEN
jgi:hypothetical protein